MLDGASGLASLAQHGATAAAGAAETCVCAFGCARVRLTDLQVVVVCEFFAGVDVAPRINENAVGFFLDFAIGLAGVIDPARRVATPGGVDHHGIIDGKKHRVWRILMHIGVSSICFIVCDQLTFVLDHAGAFRNPG